jgi:hypothetical protein
MTAREKDKLAGRGSEGGGGRPARVASRAPVPLALDKRPRVRRSQGMGRPGAPIAQAAQSPSEVRRRRADRASDGAHRAAGRWQPRRSRRRGRSCGRRTPGRAPRPRRRCGATAARRARRREVAPRSQGAMDRMFGATKDAAPVSSSARVGTASLVGTSAASPVPHGRGDLGYCRTGAAGSTQSTRCAAVPAMRRPAQLGRRPRNVYPFGYHEARHRTRRPCHFDTRGTRRGRSRARSPRTRGTSETPP